MHVLGAKRHARLELEHRVGADHDATVLHPLARVALAIADITQAPLVIDDARATRLSKIIAWSPATVLDGPPVTPVEVLRGRS